MTQLFPMTDMLGLERMYDMPIEKFKYQNKGDMGSIRFENRSRRNL